MMPQAQEPAKRRGRPANAGNDPAKREQIMDGAHRVFQDSGYDAATMQQVAEVAGVSKGTLYVYFTDKVALFEALVERQRELMFDDLRKVAETAPTLETALSEYGMLFASRVLSESGIKAHRILLGVVDRQPELAMRFYERGPARGQRLLKTLLARFQDRGDCDIADPDTAAYQFAELCLAKNFRQRLFGMQQSATSDAEIRSAVAAAVTTFMRAYGRGN